VGVKNGGLSRQTEGHCLDFLWINQSTTLFSCSFRRPRLDTGLRDAKLAFGGGRSN